MAFLTLNGVTIPVNKCDEVTKELGDRGRVFSGAYGLSRRASKRSWKFATPPIGRTQAEAIKGMVRGVGNCWRFDDSTLYDAKGVTLDAAGSQFTTIADLTALDDKVKSEVIEYGRASVLPEIEAARGSIRVDRATINSLESLKRRIQAASAAQFTAIDGATVTAETDHTITGTHALKVVTSGAVNAVNGGVYSNGVATAAGGLYVTGGVWIYSAESSAVKRTFEVVLLDATAAAYSTVVTATIEQGKWTRITIPSWWRAGASADMRLIVQEETADSAQTYYIDGLQIEQHSGEVGSSGWVDGTRAVADTIVLDNTNFLSGETGDYTFNAWVSNGEMDNASAARYLLHLSSTAAIGADSPMWLVYRPTADQKIWAGVVPSSGGAGIAVGVTLDFEGGDGYDAGQMQMITCVIRQDPASGEYNLELHFNGALAGGVNGDVTGVNKLSDNRGYGGFGVHRGGGSPWNGAIDDAAILPYAADATTIAAWYANGQHSAVPAHIAAGDFVRDESVAVIGELHSAGTRPHGRSGTWNNDAQVVAFTLHEV